MVAAGKTVSTLAHGASRLSKRLILSYVLDWIVIIVTAAIGAIFSKISGNKHAFSLYDPNISYPHRPSDTVPFYALVIVALAGPAVLMFIISLIFVPGSTASKHTPRSLIWRRKLWEWNTAWMGLGFALAGAFVVTEGLKDLTGKPRPDLLARCKPDLSPGALSKYRVGGLEQALSEATIIVDWHICQNTDLSVLHDGFASWPSGHSSFSWAGMLYLTLWLCSKFAISVPFLAPAPYVQNRVSTFEHGSAMRPKTTGSASSAAFGDDSVPARNQAAAPPVYLFVVGFVPIGVAMFVCVSRYADYRHAGFDIISGAVIGAVFAYIAFRWYHMPIQTGAGWSWGARSRDRAFYTGIGIPSYVGDEGWGSANAGHANTTDLESQQDATVMGAGIEDHQDGERIKTGPAHGVNNNVNEPGTSKYAPAEEY